MGDGTDFPAKTPGQLADELSRVDSVKLNFGGEVYALTKSEIDWIVLALRGISGGVGSDYCPGCKETIERGRENWSKSQYSNDEIYR